MTTTRPRPESPGDGASSDAGGPTAGGDRRARLMAALQARQGKPRVCPVSYADQRLWFVCQLVEESWFYHSAAMAELTAVDEEAFRRSLDALIARHETLRTSFRFDVDCGEPVQVIHAPVPADLTIVDLTAEMPEATKRERENEIRRNMPEFIREPFDLEEGPLFRTFLIRTSDDAHVLVLVIHHLVFDGWSMNVLLRDLAALYEAEIGSGPAKLPPLTLQYADVAMLQREQLQGATLENLLAYWRDALADLPVLELPTDRARPPQPSHEGEHASIRMPDEVAEGLEAICAQEGASFFMAGLAAFALLLQRYCGQDDIVIGTPIANRNRRETENLIGCFVNTLVLRADFSGDPSFRGLLKQVRDTCLSAYEHEDLPFEKLVEELDPRRDLSRNPLFQVMFQFTQAGDFSKVEPTTSLKIRPMSLESNAVRFDLEISAERYADGAMRFNVSYRPDLFDATTIERMLSHLVRLLRGAVAAPDQPLSRLSILSDGERRQLLHEWNETDQPYQVSTTVPELFEIQAAAQPTAVAVTFAESSLSFAEMNERANQVAHHLIDRGAGPEAKVGLCVERSLEMMVGILGILKAGGAYVPLDPDYPEARLAYLVEDAGIEMILTQADLQGRIPSEAGELICLDADWPAIQARPRESPAVEIRSDALAYVIYTSGSTGRPKGVMVTHAALRNQILAMRDELQVTVDDRLLQKTPLSFDVSVLEMFLPLAVGARLVVARPDGHRDPEYIAETIARLGITVIHFVPSMLRTFLEMADLGSFPSLTRIMCGGEALTLDLVNEVRTKSNVRLFNCYGPTEAAVGVTAWRCQPRENETVVPLGRPIANTRLYVLDGAMNPVPIGAAGELHVAGIQLARGYLGRPALTAERFVPDPFSGAAGARLYRTGDLARYRADGNIEFRGRVDHQVKLRGFRIELGEIEAVLAQHEHAREVVVLCRSDAPGEKRLVAYVVPTNGASLGTSEFRGFLKERLPEYMVPSALVPLESLPLTPNGKIDRKALPAPDLRDQAGAFVAPRNGTEEVLCTIWGGVLGVDQVGVHDNFFELGGHSLLATQLTSRIRRALEIEVPLRDLFDCPTVAEMAERIQTTGARPETPLLVRCDRGGDLPLSFAQQRLWFLDQMDVGAAYNIPMVLRLHGRLDVEHLEQALQEVVRRHEALRTSFPVVNEQPVQRIAEALEFELNRIDVCDLGGEEQEAQVLRLAQEEAGRPFDLAKGPLLRGVLLTLGEAEHVLLLTMHHIVSDGWSMGVLFRELTTLYEAYSQGEASPLAELEIQYGDFAQWQRRWLAGEALDEQLSYWRKQLVNVPTLDLPTDRRRPAEQTFTGAGHGFEIPSELGEALQQLSRQEGMTPAMVLLAGWQVLLARYCGQDDVAVGSPIANRTHDALEPLIGFFVNMLVMRTDLSGDPSVEEVLRRVQEVSLSAYEHQDVPFEQVVDELSPPRDLSRHPLFQVMFAMQNAPRSALRLGDLEIDGLGSGTTTTHFDLELHLFEHAGRLVGQLVYNVDLFDDATIARMTGHFVRLLDEMVSDPSRRLSGLSLLRESERHRILVEWNDTDAPYPENQCLHELFEAQVARTPDAIAVDFEGDRLTYAELDARANRLAHFLGRHHVGPDVPVGICTERSLEMVVGLLGILKAGGAYVPLDPEYPRSRLSFMLEETQTPVVLTQHHLASVLPEHEGKVVCLDTGWSEIEREPDDPLSVEVDPDGLAYIIYTSGSTGRPKGAMNTHRAIGNRLLWMQEAYGLSCDDRVLQKTTFSFDVSVWEFFWPLITGARLIMARPGGHREPAYLVQAIAEHGVTTMHFVPSMLRAFLETPDLERLGSLKRVICSGEALPADLRDAFVRRIDAELHNLYGPTEAAIDVTACRCDDAEPGSVVPIGRPIANTTAYVLDGSMQPVPVGIAGELYIGGVQLARGYLERADLTAERFGPDPFGGSGARLYRTGDRVRYGADGNIEFLGRVDHQVKLRGFRIELGEIERVLEEHAAVDQAVSLVREDRPGDRRLVAYVVTTTGASLGTSEIQGFLKKCLPAYMVPSATVNLETIPLTPNGKIDHAALPGPAVTRDEETLVVPDTPMERLLADVWKELIGIEQVDVRDNFFEIGGHSLLIVQAAARMQKRTGVQIDLRQFLFNTLGQLARAYDAAGANAAQESAAVPSKRPLWRRLVSLLARA